MPLLSISIEIAVGGITPFYRDTRHMNLLTVPQVVERTGYKKTAVYDWCEKNLIRHVRPPSGGIRIPEEAVEEFLRAYTVEPQAPPANPPESVPSIPDPKVKPRKSAPGQRRSWVVLPPPGRNGSTNPAGTASALTGANSAA